jgi:hypothetical protein
MMHGNNTAKWSSDETEGKHIEPYCWIACRVCLTRGYGNPPQKPGWFTVMPADSEIVHRYFNAGRYVGIFVLLMDTYTQIHMYIYKHTRSNT